MKRSHSIQNQQIPFKRLKRQQSQDEDQEIYMKQYPMQSQSDRSQSQSERSQSQSDRSQSQSKKLKRKQKHQIDLQQIQIFRNKRTQTQLSNGNKLYIIRFSNNSSEKRRQFRQIVRKYCDDAFFEDAFGCSKLTTLSDMDVLIAFEKLMPINEQQQQKERYEIVGYLAYSIRTPIKTRDKTAMEVDLISTKAVDNRKRYGSGIGRALMKKVEEIAHQKGCEFIFLGSVNHGFYFKLGFKQIEDSNYFVKKIKSWPTTRKEWKEFVFDYKNYTTKTKQQRLKNLMEYNHRWHNIQTKPNDIIWLEKTK